MVGGTVFGFIGGLHYWWPKMTGKMYDENWARVAWALVFTGFNVTFFSQFVLGQPGHAASLLRLPWDVPEVPEGLEKDDKKSEGDK
jgi:heme/copper-type cytochrome/quinol oxidase subunit 1